MSSVSPLRRRAVFNILPLKILVSSFCWYTMIYIVGQVWRWPRTCFGLASSTEQTSPKSVRCLHCLKAACQSRLCCFQHISTQSGSNKDWICLLARLLYIKHVDLSTSSCRMSSLLLLSDSCPSRWRGRRRRWRRGWGWGKWGHWWLLYIIFVLRNISKKRFLVGFLDLHIGCWVQIRICFSSFDPKTPWRSAHPKDEVADDADAITSLTRSDDKAPACFRVGEVGEVCS